MILVSETVWGPIDSRPKHFLMRFKTLIEKALRKENPCNKGV